jgi:hypothetical protein
MRDHNYIRILHISTFAFLDKSVERARSPSSGYQPQWIEISIYRLRAKTPINKPAAAETGAARATPAPVEVGTAAEVPLPEA